MITLWYVKVKLKLNELDEVPERYYDDVFAKLVTDGIYDTNGNRL